MLGDTLREAREKKGLTYKDIEKGTSIRALYIEYIETGKYDELPGDVYTKGFIRSYANFLKLDANALVQAFTAERHKGMAAPQPSAQKPKSQPEKKPSAPAPQPKAPQVKPQPASAPQPRVQESAKETPAPQPKAAPQNEMPAPKQTAAQPKPRVQPKREAPKQQKPSGKAPAAPRFKAQPVAQQKRSNGKLIAVVAVVLVVLAGAVYALSGSDDTAQKAPAAQQQQQQAEAPAPKTYDGVEVTATFTADCWLEVKADGKVVYEGTLKKGDSQTWKGTDKVTVRVGDAGAVSFSVNGKDLGTAGKTGQVANKTFTKDGN